MAFSDGDNRGLAGSGNIKDPVKRANLAMQDPQRVKSRYRGSTPLNLEDFSPSLGKSGTSIKVGDNILANLGDNLYDIGEIELY